MKGTTKILVYLFQRHAFCKVQQYADYSTHFVTAMRKSNNYLEVTDVSEVHE